MKDSSQPSVLIVILNYNTYKLTLQLIERIHTRVYGCCMLLRNSKMQEIDCLDERTFLYGEEEILAERMLKAGSYSYYDADVSVIHNESSSVAKDKSNSMMLANYIAENYHVTVYWVCKDSCDTSLLSNKINIVKMGSEKCKTVIHTAKVFVMNQNFHDFSRNGWNFYGGAITINLWHGVMWKRLGSSIEDKNALVKYYYHLYYKAHEAQYWVSVSDKYSDAIEEAFGVDKKNIINSGLPRNALFYNPIMLSEAKKRILSAIKKNNCIPENPYIISYMPTFRDEKDSLFDFNSFADDENFIEFLESNNVIIIQKAHFVSEHRTHETVSRKISRIINENEVSATTISIQISNLRHPPLGTSAGSAPGAGG